LVALTLSDLRLFLAGGVLIGVTPFFVAGPPRGGPAAIAVAVGGFSATTWFFAHPSQPQRQQD
jgi:hypothetical protein